MARYFFLILLFLSSLSTQNACAQNDRGDSLPAVSGDSSESTAGDTVETMDINPYSQYRLTAHSGHLADNPVRQVDSSQVKSYQLNPDYAYSNDPDYWKKKEREKPGTLDMILHSLVIRWIFYCIVAGLVIFGIFQLAKENNFTGLSRTNRNFNPDQAAGSVEKEVDLSAAIQKYQSEGDYRMAIRFLYLRVLRELSEKTGIGIRDSSTNAEIAGAFADRTAGADFRFLYRAYEYIFYGGFTPSRELYLSLKTKFEDFHKSFSA